MKEFKKGNSDYTRIGKELKIDKGKIKRLHEIFKSEKHISQKS